MTALWWALWIGWFPLQWVGTDSLKTPESFSLSPSGVYWVRWHQDSLWLGTSQGDTLLLVPGNFPLLGARVSDSGQVLLVRKGPGTHTLLEACFFGKKQWTLRLPPLVGLRYSQDSHWLLAATPEGLFRIHAAEGTLQGRFPVAPVYQAQGQNLALAEGFRVSLYRDTLLLWQIPLGTNRIRALYFVHSPPGFLLVYTAEQMVLLDSTGHVLWNQTLEGEYQAGTVGPAGPLVSWQKREVVGVYWWDERQQRFWQLVTLRPYRIGQRIRLSALGVRGDTLWILHNAKLVRFAVQWPLREGDHAGP